jgi:hypothetical protein
MKGPVEDTLGGWLWFLGCMVVLGVIRFWFGKLTKAIFPPAPPPLPKLNFEELYKREIDFVIGQGAKYKVVFVADSMVTGLDGELQYRHAFIQTETGQYAEVFVTEGDEDCSAKLVPELVVRRALFNKPKEYMAAFGESPDRKQLARLMGGADA